MGGISYSKTDASGMSTAIPNHLKRQDNETEPAYDHIEFIVIHQHQYNPAITWFNWQSTRTGRNSLVKQNDIAYRNFTRRTPGLHEQHLAEELHRHSILPTTYMDDKNRTSLINPSIPPFGHPHFSNWTSDRFNAMWLFWSECFPAHASDIGRELHICKQEGREPWWSWKSKIKINQMQKAHKLDKETHRPFAKPDKGFEYIFLAPPCRICGSSDHSALQGLEDDYDDIIYRYTCPIAAHGNWELESMRPCPEKLAHWCHLSSEQIDSSIEQMIEFGWGQHVTRKTMQIFRACAIQYCETDSEGSDTDLFDTSILYSSK